MAKLLVLGVIPGTHIQITFYIWLLAGLVVVGGLLLVSYWRALTTPSATSLPAVDPELIAL